MKIIKHLINIMFLWSIPYILTAFFLVLTWFAFSYVAVVTSGVWITFTFFYCMITGMMYMIGSGEVDDMSILKP
jgi:hypothetical protein